MSRSPFSKTNSPTNNSNKNINKKASRASGLTLLVQILLLGTAITILAAIFVQNLQPAVQVFFLGQKSIAIPLSVLMFAALALGGILTLVINAIATWRQKNLIRRAVIASTDSKPKPNPASSSNPPSATYVDDREDDREYEEDDDDEPDDDWEDDEEIDEDFEEEYEDDDPDTVPYGDRLKNKSNSKSQNPRQAKRDRPPLDAKFIKR